VKTLGDRILVKRFEKGLSQRQLAHLLDIPISRVMQLENDLLMPTDTERQALASVLSLDSGNIRFKPNA
jgi:transcriptional regulator with XRE-family HTH domain